MVAHVDFPTFLQQIGVLEEKTKKTLFPKDGMAVGEMGAQIQLLQNQANIDSQTLDYYLSEWQQLPVTQLEEIDKHCLDALPEKICRRFLVIPFQRIDGTLRLAVMNPYNEGMLSALSQWVNEPYCLYLVPSKLLTQALDRSFRQTGQIETLAKTAKTVAVSERATKKVIDGIDRLDTKASVVNLLDHMLQDALQCQATDIHIEANFDHLIYYYRVGHETSEVVSMPLEISDMLVQRLIVLGDGDIAQKKLPQDLSFSFSRKDSDETISVRLSVLFTLTGYSVVMRLLLSQAKLPELEELLVDKKTFEDVTDFLRSEHGMMLVTGPTASGKTTLLYSILKRIHDGCKKIISIEDPVEIQFSHMNQVQVNPDIGLDFSEVIRSSLRQNPDVLMVGEIRDKVTANMAMRAAITGVLVFSTLHTSSTKKTVTRLFDLGVDPFLLGSSIRVVLSTRLLKRVCSQCKEKPRSLSEEERRLLIKQFDDVDKMKVVQGKGCQTCHETGEHGLALITEKLSLNTDYQELIIRADFKNFEEKVSQELVGSLLVDHAKALVDQGEIPVGELIKLVCDL